jgi:hypothetical protein
VRETHVDGVLERRARWQPGVILQWGAGGGWVGGWLVERGVCFVKEIMSGGWLLCWQQYHVPTHLLLVWQLRGGRRRLGVGDDLELHRDDGVLEEREEEDGVVQEVEADERVEGHLCVSSLEGWSLRRGSIQCVCACACVRARERERARKQPTLHERQQQDEPGLVTPDSPRPARGRQKGSAPSPPLPPGRPAAARSLGSVGSGPACVCIMSGEEGSGRREEAVVG